MRYGWRATWGGEETRFLRETGFLLHPTWGFERTGIPVDNDRADVVRQVKEANDIVDVVGAYVNLRPVGAVFKGLCPFHDDHKPSFDVDPRRQRYRCWSCNKYGDVYSFVQERERIDFREALELLARRAGITLRKTPESPHQRSRAVMLDLVRWAATQYHQCLLDSPLAEDARRYVGERGLTGETVRKFGVGFAPAAGDWLLKLAHKDGVDVGLLEQLGLVGTRQDGSGHYDRFRDRVMFPIRDVQGRALGFGGRILPNSPFADRSPKYYNSAGTPLFTKGEHLYGLDLARPAAASCGYLAVVEGYTDVLMAHQHGVAQVVSTMGTALNARHVHHLRRFVPRVVLVFDADAGGDTGVDRALQVFASENVEVSIATLPAGLDPCDLLVKEGAPPFVDALGKAVDALEFKLNQAVAAEDGKGVEGKRRIVDGVLGILALTPAAPGDTVAVKQELMLTRIAQRLGLAEETVRRRLRELRQSKRSVPAAREERPPEKRSAPASPTEQELLEVLLAQPDLIPVAAGEIAPEQILHPGLRQLLGGLYALQAMGKQASLDGLRSRIENPALIAWALEHQEKGLANPDRPGWLRRILALYRQRGIDAEKQEVQSRLRAVDDHAAALELLRQLQQVKASADSP